jgi:tetratricopeptide (TPR) repeat protein
MCEAVEHCRVLAEKAPQSYRPNLAGSLSNLGLVLRDLDRREEELEATREVVKHFRVLAQKDPESFGPKLANKLNDLGFVLWELDRREEALEAVREAVERYRALAEKDPESFRSDLAGSLNNLGLVLGDLDRKREALEAMREAVGHYSQLAEEIPKGFPSDLANSLMNLALQQSALGRREEALASVQLGVNKSPVETVSIFTLNPTRFFKQLSAKEMHSWLGLMLTAELPLELKEQLRLHHQMATLLVDRENGAPEEHIRQALGRVPPELRELVESILERGKQS